MAIKQSKMAGKVLYIPILALMSACSCPPTVEYRAVPAYLIPMAPDLPTIAPQELAPLSDATYVKVGTRDRMLRQYADELKAVLTGKNGDE